MKKMDQREKEVKERTVIKVNTAIHKRDNVKFKLGQRQCGGHKEIVNCRRL